MKILLQHARTQLYLRSLGNWTADPGDAHDFQDSLRAIHFVRKHSITGVQIAVNLHDLEFDEVLPIPTSNPETARVSL